MDRSSSTFFTNNVVDVAVGCKYECYIVEEVIVVDDLDEGNIYDAAGKEDK